MDHIAIMKKKWKLIPKILDGSKTIESRWYVNRIKPWNSLKIGEKIYFKNSGEPITACAEVSQVLQFEKLDKQLFETIMKKYADDIGLINKEYNKYYQSKNYCILIFLKNAKQVEPFNISKEGFGSACAWMCVENIKEIKI